MKPTTPSIEKKTNPSESPFLARLYETRRSSLPTLGIRTRTSMIVSVILALAMISILLSLSWVQRSEIDYLKSSSVATILDDQKWNVTLPSQPSQTLNFLDLSKVETSVNKEQWIILSAEISSDTLLSVKSSQTDEPIILSLPYFGFSEALVQGSWFEDRRFLSGETLAISFSEYKKHPGKSLETITVKLKPRSNQKTILPSSVNQMPTFIAGQVRFQKFQDFIASKRVGSGKQLADIGRIVLALFCVLLFIFIDSSPECLGLGIFMSLKALGVVASQRWYPDVYLPAWLIGSLPSFLLGFADFMQLYFFTQLARLLKPKAMTWFVVGAVFGLGYSFAVSLPTVAGGINWSREVWRYRNLFIGIGCLACALPVAYKCLRSKHYHRATALIIASSGVLSQVITPLISDIPGISEMLWYKTWYNLLETHTPYMFALSTFVNVSTLEKRVKVLTEVGLQAKLMEQEMHLGKAVQETFFRTPKMPEGIHLEISHHAEMFVSGDMIYSNHDPLNNTVTALLCDVTGHGVQAALKASVCSVICDSIWDVKKLRKDDKPYQRLEILHHRATGFLNKNATLPELLAVVGCEVLLEERKAYFYRSNAVFPLVIFKNMNSHRWDSNLVVTTNETIQEVSLDGLSFIVLFSDGLIDSSRTYKKFKNWLELQLNQSATTHISAKNLRDLILGFDQWNETHDDRTMCVLEVSALVAKEKAA